MFKGTLRTLTLELRPIVVTAQLEHLVDVVLMKSCRFVEAAVILRPFLQPLLHHKRPFLAALAQPQVSMSRQFAIFVDLNVRIAGQNDDVKFH